MPARTEDRLSARVSLVMPLLVATLSLFWLLSGVIGLFQAGAAAHVLGACVLIGTGAGIAFFMVMAHRTRDAASIAHTAAIVVIADTIFTATAAILQPIIGITLA